jgi:endonuclease I
MKKSILFVCLLFAGLGFFAQPLSYYNGTEGLEATALKTALNNIIDGHQQYYYGSVKQILRQSDEDPSISDNIILLYTGWSIPKTNFASNLDSLNFWNREHVWAKSHGDFGTDVGPGTDAHAIRPVDATVNSARSYKDFDNGGSQYLDAGVPTGCYADNDSWEPRDAVKGDVARMIFYMATRYEGENGELDLQVVDQVGTYPYPKHGKLSTLLAWNQQDPPDAFERNRNDVVANWQNNRNPFVDYPEFADYIWNNVSANPIEITAVTNNPVEPDSMDVVTISANIAHTVGTTISSATINWGTSWGTLNNQISLTASGSVYSGQIPAQAPGTKVFFRIDASTVSEDKYFVGSYQVAIAPFNGTLTSIYDIQGQVANTPYAGQVVSTSGIVTGAFGENFFLQSGTGPWSGIYVYESGYFLTAGDSIIVTGEADEYYGKTEIKSVANVYLISSNNPMPEPLILPSGGVEDEQYEGVLIKLLNVQCVNDTAFGMWMVDDGTGIALIHNSSTYGHPYVIGEFYDITGPLNYDFDQFKIELRSADDVEAGTDNLAPIILSAAPVTPTLVYVNFNESVELNSAQDVNNYSINNGIIISNALRHSFDFKKVILTVSELQSNSYTLSVNNIEDFSGNIMTLTEVQFSYLGMNEQTNEQIAIFPNPSNGIISLNLRDETGASDIGVFDLSGRLLEYYQYENKRMQIDLSHLPNGVYFLKVESDQKKFVSKISIVK